jgi:hypothetical protein
MRRARHYILPAPPHQNICHPVLTHQYNLRARTSLKQLSHFLVSNHHNGPQASADDAGRASAARPSVGENLRTRGPRILGVARSTPGVAVSRFIS